jgi:hypothetical protein
MPVIYKTINVGNEDAATFHASGKRAGRGSLSYFSCSRSRLAPVS